MLIHLYEEVICADGSKIPGRILGEVRCEGDGTPGEFIYFDIPDDSVESKNADEAKGIEKIERRRKRKGGRKKGINPDKFLLNHLFNQSFFIPINEKIGPDGVMQIEGKNIPAWTGEAMEFILEYKLRTNFGKIRGKIVEY